MLRSFPAISLSLTLPLALLQALPPGAAAQEVSKPRQLLIISFDGAADNGLWARSRGLASFNHAHFTYFLSCTNLIARPDKAVYQPPQMKPGRSNIGFAASRADVSARLDHIWQAHLEGHDIASHGCGHFDGKDWSKADWLQEFTSFDAALKGAWTNNGIAERQPDGWADFAEHGIKGFRAPYLSAPKSLVAAEKAAGFVYDASLVTRGPALPEEDGSLARFGLPLIPEGPNQRRIIGMDYNLFVRHSAGLDNPSRSAEFETRTLDAFKAAFEEQYSGDRIPVQFGFHFVEMNGGAYWRALERLVTDVCNRPDVGCVSYAEALDILAGKDAAKASSF
ncbi:MAG: polysaccharide deacetylase [Allorhizobium sp.]